eukprot:10645677-Alexandrium_andersonii.AAC.1
MAPPAAASHELWRQGGLDHPGHRLPPAGEDRGLQDWGLPSRWLHAGQRETLRPHRPATSCSPCRSTPAAQWPSPRPEPP